jgi:hypothetical protein
VVIPRIAYRRSASRSSKVAALSTCRSQVIALGVGSHLKILRLGARNLQSPCHRPLASVQSITKNLGRLVAHRCKLVFRNEQGGGLVEVRRAIYRVQSAEALGQSSGRRRRVVLRRQDPNGDVPTRLDTGTTFEQLRSPTNRDTRSVAFVTLFSVAYACRKAYGPMTTASSVP